MARLGSEGDSAISLDTLAVKPYSRHRKGVGMKQIPPQAVEQHTAVLGKTGGKRRRLPIPDKKLCVHCGTEFQPTAKYPQQRFCGHKCQFAAQRGPEFNARIARASVAERAAKQRGGGAGKSYIKLNGRHMHRVIAEQKLGRPLLPGEIVHHADGNKRNNDPDNLVVLQNQAEHARVHGGQRRRPRTLCKNGHRIEGDNLLVLNSGGRRCRTCYVAKAEAYKARLREETKARRARMAAGE